MRDDDWLPWNWQATAEERMRWYPCDDLLVAPQHRFFRAVDVAAPVSLVFRWLQQLRIAPYSYDWVDNFAIPSPPRLVARAESIAAGQRMMHVLRIHAFEPDCSLTLHTANSLGRALFGTLAGTYTVAPNAGGTRLFVKVNATYPRSLYGRAMDPLMPWIDYAMMRKQLLRLRALAEREAR